MPTQKITVKQMIKELNHAKINTWFDLGLFIDSFKENNSVPVTNFNGDFNDFSKEINNNAIGFISFYYSIDGVTIEIEKYTKVVKRIFPDTQIHYISGEHFPEANEVLPKHAKKFEISEMKSFDKWSLYKDFFFTKLQRGSKEYNQLIIDFWSQTKIITEKLGNYIEQNNIKVLYLLNTNSNPGNVSLSLATVLISEFMGIPIINNNHDFYWEGGESEINRKINRLPNGPRDFFFQNSHIGEFFSQIETLFPWESRNWISVNINREQSKHLIEINGHNPANICEIGTAIDTDVYQKISKRQKIDAFIQFNKIFSDYSDALLSYSVDDIVAGKLVRKDNIVPILMGDKTSTIKNFLQKNIVFLQPTRVVERKRIEIGLKLIKKLFEREDFIKRISETKDLKITLLVTGPIPTGQFSYFNKLTKEFREILNQISPEFRDRIFLGFLFSELDKDRFKHRFINPIGLPELYNIASLILLPSETEGRGLPIIEATTTGVPIFCNRYTPEKVYSEVIGEHLPETERLKVIEFKGVKIKSSHLQSIIDRVFFPHQFVNEVAHNKQVIEKRYSLKFLEENMKEIFIKLHLQLTDNEIFKTKAHSFFKEYKKTYDTNSKEYKYIINTENREYLPGFGRIGFMIYLKSLIDPSYFRVEEQNMRGKIMHFANKLLKYYSKISTVNEKQKLEYFNIVDNIFKISDGDFKIKHDHSLSYRHRNSKHYLFHDYTLQELFGLVNMIFHKAFNYKDDNKIETNSHFFTDWNLALLQMTSSTNLGIDDRNVLFEKLESNIPMAFFPTRYIEHELEVFVIQSIRRRFKISIEDPLSEILIEKSKNDIEPIYIFTSKHPLPTWPSTKRIIEYLNDDVNSEMRILYKNGIIKIVETNQWTAGIHFQTIGKEALKALAYVKDNDGFIISLRRNAAFMTDIVDIDKFHIGHTYTKVGASIMGLEIGQGYIQYVPAGIRPTLAFPTPVQTAKNLSEIRKSDLYKSTEKRLGKKALEEIFREDAKTKGNPLKNILENLNKESNKKSNVEYSFVTGVYSDGLPWNGAISKANLNNGKNWGFSVLSDARHPKKVTDFVASFEKTTKQKSEIAWNGGYILNAELVGKLGLPETYIGSPLGLLISNGKLLSAPLFNKPAIIIYKNGKVDIRRVNSSNGIKIGFKGKNISFPKESYNSNKNGLAYYDLLYNKNFIDAQDKIIIRLTGNKIMEIIEPEKNKKIKIIPVGLTLVIPKDKFNKLIFKLGNELDIDIVGLEKIQHAVEAGPLLIDNSKLVLDMDVEGWKTDFSIATQAARLDYTDMRGPKIAAGIDKDGNLHVLTINGRIRESVGATHIDMAEIMLKYDMIKAMGFDPGGSSTLVVGNKTLNISPYNKEYEKNIYALPPEPRAVANTIIGFVN
jgi:hypothetical protein